MPVRSTSSSITVGANRSTGTSRNIPPRRPAAGRIGSQMTASRTSAMVLPCPSDRELGIAPPLRRGRLAGAGGDDPVVYLLTHLGNGHVTVDDAPRVEVDVAGHAGEDTAVGGDLQARRDRRGGGR